MIYIPIFMLSALVGAAFSRLTPAWVPSIVCAAAFTGLVIYNEFIVPYKEGDASLWPIALLFGIPVTSFGAYAGWHLARRILLRRWGNP